MRNVFIGLVTLMLLALLVYLSGVPNDTSIQNSVSARGGIERLGGESNSLAVIKAKPAQFVGSQQCVSCHADAVAEWQESDHFRAMQSPQSTTVMGDFDDVTTEFHQLKTRFYRKGSEYWVDTLGDSEEVESFQVKHTFGHFPLQQYLVETQNGHVQALNVAWDSRSKEQGGQRWFHLQAQEPINQQHPFYWTKHFQNWNSRCADCHSTNLQRNYSPADNSFATRFSEPNVACEACHGAASEHLALAQAGDLQSGSGFAIQSAQKLRWQYKDNRDIAVATGQPSSDEVNMCARCHSLRSPLIPEAGTAAGQGQGFHDLNRLQLLNTTTYFADGQSKEEAFVTGSFLQSKMHHKGVSCSNCHNPHTGKTLADDNSLCAQCHKPEVYDTAKHHRHEARSEGAACVNCHMPARPFMQVDLRRDHSFTIPRPDLSLSLGVPNACTGCHSEQDDTWAAEQTKSWGAASSGQHWAHTIARATANDALVTRTAVTQVLDTGLPDLVRASLLSHLAPIPSRVSADLSRQALLDQSPLVRRAAVAALRGQADAFRWDLLEAHFADPSRSVRIEVAEALVRGYTNLSQTQRAALAPLLAELRLAYSASLDSVSTQLNLANLELNLGNPASAEAAYKQALLIEPSYVPAILSLAEFYRSTGQAELERPLLEQAISVAPDSGAAQHSLGLFHVRAQDYATAIDHLALAVQQVDASPYYAYVYAVALEHQGQMSLAIDQLKSADQRWPNQYELLYTLILYLEKAGKSEQVLPYLSKLSALAPAAPTVKQLLAKYRTSS